MPTNLGYDKSTGGDDLIESITNSVAINGGTITSSGVLYSQTVNPFATNNTIVVDTGTVKNTAKDINLIIQSPLTLSSKQLLVKGVNNVYIYLATGANLTLVSSNIAMTDNSTSPESENPIIPSKIFIIGDKQVLDVSGNCILRANIYLPEGPLQGYIWSSGDFRGTYLVTDDNSLWANIAFVHAEPDLTNTPLVGFVSGKYSTGKWSLEGWSQS
jgi:hypothetical protein